MRREKSSHRAFTDAAGIGLICDIRRYINAFATSYPSITGFGAHVCHIFSMIFSFKKRLNCPLTASLRCPYFQRRIRNFSLLHFAPKWLISIYVRRDYFAVLRFPARQRRRLLNSAAQQPLPPKLMLLLMRAGDTFHCDVFRAAPDALWCRRRNGTRLLPIFIAFLCRGNPLCFAKCIRHLILDVFITLRNSFIAADKLRHCIRAKRRYAAHFI